MKLCDIIKGIHIEETNIYDFRREITNISRDCRTVGVGDMFVCLRGTAHDGHAFIHEAWDKGASVIVVEECVPFCGIPSCKCEKCAGIQYIRVQNSRAAYARMWYNMSSYHKDRFGKAMRLIAVTGTNGKTTTAHIMSSILTAAGYKTAVIGTITDGLTTPDPETLYPHLGELADEGYEFTIMEASSHSLALDKLAPLHFEIGIFTNLTPEHLDFHNTMEEYCRAKAKLFSLCDIGIFNADDKYYTNIISDSAVTCKKITYSVDAASDYVAKDSVFGTYNGIGFNFCTPSESFYISSLMQGRFNIYNLLAAAVCADIIRIPRESIECGILRLPQVSGRFERVPVKKEGVAVFIDYAHTPDALENVCRSLRETMKHENRLILLFGCGGDRDKTKRPVMGRIASRYADFTIVTSDNSRGEEPHEIINDILKGIDKERPYAVIENRREAIEYVIKNAQSGDIILLAGKGHETYEITRDGKSPFSEKEIIKNAEESE